MIAVLGSINLDFVVSAGQLPSAGQTVLGTTFEAFPGGKGANQALAARRAGSDVFFLGKVGGDEHSGAASTHLEKAGVDLTLLRQSSLPTGVASIFVGENGENMIVVIPGANTAVGQDTIDDAMGKLGPGDYLVVQMEIPGETVLGALVAAKAAGVKTLLNTAPFTGAAAEAALLADIVVMNETELEAFAMALGHSVTNLAAFFGQVRREEGQIFVVTRGKGGAKAFQGAYQFDAPAIDVVPIDTVGAGDTFVGYFAAALDQGHAIENALRRATVAGSLACLSKGAQTGMPSKVEVDAVLGSGESDASPS